MNQAEEFKFHNHYRFMNKMSAKMTIDKDGRQTNPKGIMTKGGCTVSAIKVGDELRWGVSRCNRKDVFNKRIGRIRSTGLAKSKSAAITPMIDNIKDIKEIADEFARVAMETSYNEFMGVIQVPAFKRELIEKYSIVNNRFEKIPTQQTLL